VGALVVIAMLVLVGLVFLMSSSTGGLFAKKLYLRAYFKNAGGLKTGAPVTLEGVTIGNVRKIRVVPARQPFPVEVSMEVGRQYLDGLHSDSTAAIAQAGVLGDSYVDIDSGHASGPPPADHAELPVSGSPTIQDVIQSSQASLDQIHATMIKVNKLLDTANSDRGTVGKLLNDPAFAQKFVNIAANLQTITGAIAQGKGTAGKLVMDDTLYTHLDSTVNKLDQIATGLNDGKGTMGKLLKDETVYKNLNDTLASTKELVAQINAGKGTLGKLAKDPVFAQKMQDTVANLDAILKGIHEGQGTMGQLFTNRSVYDNTNLTLIKTRDLLDAFRANPKKYLTVQLKLF
jgi:phospholipid/cholesterol/gamma-HCH transport system substrate-binding protein